ncbi:ABC transporter permease [Nonomuraea sp. KC401]|uniref:ABC transporter permease n=1 Tax=unclassified Nonomuraea TaxID=2593643 RepID=UPI0010FCF614|nr:MULTISPECIES: ABC transporter permease [unclassified Nonomuraea]NBE93914.1 ABC transporter permease subunit [Nonomuraea sp. K271]TLF76289.1 ABC transporter permease [Nonomuraea sp. KC401]
MATAPESVAQALPDTPSRTNGGRKPFFKRMLANRRTSVAGAFLLLIVVVAVFAPLIAPHDYRDIVGKPLTSGGALGIDDFGRDVLSRLIIGLRTSLGVAVSAVLVAGVIGVALGLVAGYVGRWVSTIIMRGIDVLLSFPPIVLAIAVVAILGPALVNVVLVIGVLYIPRFTRIVYSQVLSIRSMEYVEASKIMGTRPADILAKTILPNVSAPITVQLSLSVSFAIQMEAGLSFLGLGAQPPLPSLGTMVGAGRDFLEVQPTLLIYPSVLIILVVLALNVFGDGMRDLLDPRHRGKNS